MNTSYVIGFIIGLVVTVLFIIIIAKVITKIGNNNGESKTEYDERQKMVIGQGYKIAFWTLSALLVVVQMFIEIGKVANFCSPIKAEYGTIAFSIIIISIMVFCIYCIWNGAYFGLNNNKKRYIIILLAIGVLNILISVGNIIMGNMVVDGQLTGYFVNLMCGIMMFVVVGAVGLRDYLDKKSDEKEDEE